MEQQTTLMDEETEYDHIFDKEDMKHEMRNDEPWDIEDQLYEEWRDERRHLEVQGFCLNEKRDSPASLPAICPEAKGMFPGNSTTFCLSRHCFRGYKND